MAGRQQKATKIGGGKVPESGRWIFSRSLGLRFHENFSLAEAMA